MTYLEAIIFDFIKQNSSISYLIIPYQKLIKRGVLPGQSFALLKRLVKKNDIVEFENKLLQYFKKYQIGYLERKRYLAKERQKTFRIKHQDDKKQLNFYLDIDTWHKLQSFKGKKTYNQVIKELLEK